jgi:hypothetical protein
MKFIALTLSTTAVLLAAGSLSAHHGDAGRFEETTTTITGTVLALQLVNPHSAILFSADGESGSKVTWQAEMGGPQQLNRNFGWTRNTLKPGDRIAVTGRVVKSGAPHINLTERARIVLLPACEEIYVTRSEPDEPLDCSS